MEHLTINLTDVLTQGISLRVPRVELTRLGYAALLSEGQWRRLRRYMRDADSLHHPYVVWRGRKFGVITSIFNYLYFRGENNGQ